MTSVLAPVKNITLQGIAPDVIQSCVLAPPPPTPAPEPEDVIYAPVAPGITYGSLPVITTGTTPGNLVIVDTSPDQIIGCANDVGTDPQSRLNALFPSAADGDGVVDRATNNIWVYDGATWNNVGPTPGPTLTVNSTIPPWNEIVVYDARVRTRLEVNGLAYALELLTEPAAYGVTLGLGVQTSQAFVEVPAVDIAFAAATAPIVSSGASLTVPLATVAVAGFAPLVAGGASVAAPVTDTTLLASMMPYVGPQATVVQPPAAITGLTANTPLVSSGASIVVAAIDISLAAAAPTWDTNSAPTVVSIGAQASSAFDMTVNLDSFLQNDIILVIAETSGDGTMAAPSGALGTWQAVPGTPVLDTPSTPASGSELYAWWIRAGSDSTGSDTVYIPDSGDHQVVRVVTIRGCRASGNPWDVTTTATKSVADATATAPAVTTTVPLTLVLSVVSRPNDSASTTAFGTPSNANLTSLTKQGEAGASVGNGGGFVVSTGVKDTAGNTGTTTYSSAPNVTNAALTIAFRF